MNDFIKKLDTQSKALIGVGLISLLLFISLLLSRYSNQNDALSTTKDLVTYNLSSNYLPEIELGHYALWGVDSENNKVLLKRFNFNGQSIVDIKGTRLSDFKLEKDMVFDKYEVSIEEIGDWEDEQSVCMIMNAESNTNSFYFTDIFNLDNTSGTFVLGTPTDSTSETNEYSGIWFTNELDGSNTKGSLKLQPLNSCFNYSAYALHQNKYFRIGSITDANEPDNFKDYSIRLRQNNPQVPGEDFLRNLPYTPYKLNSLGDRVVLAIEPRETLFRLYSEYTPYWPVLEYLFDESEEARTPIKLELAPQPELVLTIEE